MESSRREADLRTRLLSRSINDKNNKKEKETGKKQEATKPPFNGVASYTPFGALSLVFGLFILHTHSLTMVDQCNTRELRTPSIAAIATAGVPIVLLTLFDVDISRRLPGPLMYDKLTDAGALGGDESEGECNWSQTTTSSTNVHG